MMPSALFDRPPIGRFAPSPTGELHLGSLLTAIASFVHAKSLGGKWLVRIEDTDFERCKPIFSDKILTDLEKLGLFWDEEPLYQSKRLNIYHEYLAQLNNHLYACRCSRKQLTQFGAVYPRFCLNTPLTHHEKWRLTTPNIQIGFVDEYQGPQWQNPQTLLGDVIVRRNNGMINYIFACAIDDGLTNINSLVRGLDILPMTATQLLIQKWLHLPTPIHFAHLPLLTQHGQKLSKQNLATPIDIAYPARTLCHALTLLGMPLDKHLEAGSPTDVINFAIKHWWGDWQQSLINKQQIELN